MWIERLTSSRTANALELAARFAESRHHVLAENLANIDTPDYRTRQLDPAAFRQSLREALDATRGLNAAPLSLQGNRQFATNPDGSVRVAPATKPAQNGLFHDGTNARLESIMGEIAQNSMDYELATSLLRSRAENLLRAIRGRIS